VEVIILCQGPLKPHFIAYYSFYKDGWTTSICDQVELWPEGINQTKDACQPGLRGNKDLARDVNFHAGGV